MDDSHTLNIAAADIGRLSLVSDSPKLEFFNPDKSPTTLAFREAMEADGTRLADSDRFGARAVIDFAEDGTMYVLFPATGIVRRYKPEAS